MGFPYPHPLGLPKGSVRATITLSITINLILLTFDQSKEELANLIAVAAAVSMTFYFGGRMRGIQVTPRDRIDETIDEASKKLAASERAWGLPAGTIRGMLILIFATTLGYLQFQGDEIPDALLEIINIIGGFLLGRGFNRVKLAIFGDQPHIGTTIIDHLKALHDKKKIPGIERIGTFQNPRAKRGLGI
ncbi:MAG: hypothetical protein IH840_17445, partial [Candidatus Heimdallarchaeota archaeon]|nr:hypothetical protein [Candidatus Heimdallarchaeota archaeon]